MSRVVVVQHAKVEGLGRLEALLRAAGLVPELIAPDAAAPITALDDARALIVLGGPMSVYEAETYPRLTDELRLIERALREEIPLLGICLGSQLLAAALGASVYPGAQKELGWFDVTLEPDAREDPLCSPLPAAFPALHWHGDVFDLPAGARPLARSALTRHQAFAYGPRAYGLLFHLEADVAQVSAMAEQFEDEVRSVGQTRAALIEATARHAQQASQLAAQLFGAFIDMARR